MSVNSSPLIPDVPFLLGYFVVKGENGPPLNEKDLFKVRGPDSNLYFHDNSKNHNFDFLHLLT